MPPKVTVKKEPIGNVLKPEINWPPTLVTAMKDKSYSICVVGPVGSGKSSWAVWKIINTCAAYSDRFSYTKWCIVRSTYRELKDTTQKTYFYWFPYRGYVGSTYWKDKFGDTGDSISFGEYRASDETVIYTFNNNGRQFKVEFMFRSAENDQDIKKFKSLEISGYHIDEAIEIDKEVKLMLDNRCGRVPLGWPRSLAILTTNPPDERNWVYKEYFGEDKLTNEDPAKNHAGYKQIAGENEVNLPVGYYDRLRQSYANNPDWVNRYIEGNWGIILEGEEVYPEFEESFHTTGEVIKPNLAHPIICGLDFGLTPACAYTQFLPEGEGKWIIFDELQEFNMGTEQFAEKMILYNKINYPGYRFEYFADPAGWDKSETDTRSCIDILIPKGIYPVPGEKTFTDRKESVSRYLRKVINGKPALLVSKKKCPMIFNGFSGGYHYPKSRSGAIFRDRPAKNEYSHLHDGLQYIASKLLSYKMSEELKDWEVARPARSYAMGA